MAECLERWITNPMVPGLKPLGGSKFKCAFRLFEADEMSTRNSLGLVVKGKLSFRSGSHPWGNLMLSIEREHKVLFF